LLVPIDFYHLTGGSEHYTLYIMTAINIYYTRYVSGLHFTTVGCPSCPAYWRSCKV